MKINFRLRTQEEIPDKFFSLLKSHPNEFGIYINKAKSSLLELYEIEDTEADLVVGYFYIDKKNRGNYFSVIIEEKFRGKKLAKESLKKAKEILIDRGINTIYAQVNRNTTQGIFVRKWILREDFKIKDKNKFWLQKSDEEYVERYNGPVEFYLNL